MQSVIEKMFVSSTNWMCPWSLRHLHGRLSASQAELAKLQAGSSLGSSHAQEAGAEARRHSGSRHRYWAGEKTQGSLPLNRAALPQNRNPTEGMPASLTDEVLGEGGLYSKYNSGRSLDPGTGIGSGPPYKYVYSTSCLRRLKTRLRVGNQAPSHGEAPAILSLE